ncbi:prolipoprotein diacylglyceryl transferase [Mycoplasmatota bacterium]|nr:prolipoprotein diacylglyceryl transferase [Mycoplasmatota bacterium]
MLFKFNEGNIFIEIGPFTIMWYAVLILSGVMVAVFLGVKEGEKIGVPKDFIYDLALYGVPISVIGARIYYVSFSWDQYANNLIDVFRIDQGGLAIHGAVIAAVIWGLIYCEVKEVNFLKAVDLGAVGFLVAQAIGRWGNFMNQEAHGGVVPGNSRTYLEGIGLPNFIIDKMYIEGSYYHPTFLYESTWNILGMAFLMLLRRTKHVYIGDLGLVYLMWYSVGRCLIEGMRTDSLYIGDTGIRIAQLISILLFALGAIVLSLRHFKKWYPKYYYQIIEENIEE